MTEKKYNSYDRESVKQKFTEQFGEMLEPSEIEEGFDTSETLFTIWPGNNVPVFPKFQFKDDGTPNTLFLKVLEIIGESGSFYSPKLICDKLFKADENGVRGINLIQNGNKKKAIAWAKNFDNIRLTLF